jgi:hypothetical protein
MTQLQTKSIAGIARHLPVDNGVEELRRVLNHVYNAIQNNMATTTVVTQQIAQTATGSMSLSSGSGAGGWWTGVTPPFAFLATDSSGDLVLDADGCATLVKIV